MIRRPMIEVPARETVYEHPVLPARSCLSYFPAEVCACGAYALRWSVPADLDER